MLRKLLCLLVVVALGFSFVACSNQSETNEPDETTGTTTKAAQTTTATTTKAQTTAATTKAETTVKVEENPFAERMELNFLTGQGNAEYYEEGRWDELELEEKFNVDLHVWNIKIKSGVTEQITMMLAAGDVPDWGYYYQQGRNLYDQGLSRTIPLKMIQEYLPGYYKQIEKDNIVLHLNTVKDETDPNYGDMFGINMMSPNNFVTFNTPLWRLDWLENLGYEFDNVTPIPSSDPAWQNKVYFTTTLFSVDDVKELMRALTEDDPDGNGENDTFGAIHSLFDNNDQYITNVMFGFDRNGSHLYKDPTTGNYVPYYAHTPYKDMWMFLTEMLDKGYIVQREGEVKGHPESMALWATGKFGLMFTPYNRIFGYYALSVGWPPKTIVEDIDPNATFLVTRPMGAGKYKPHAVFGYAIPNDYIVSKEVDDNKLQRLFQLIEYSYFGENWMRYKFGIENVHYTWAGEPFNSELYRTPQDKIPAKYKGTGQVAEEAAWGLWGNLHFVPDVKISTSYNPYALTAVEYWNKHFPGGYYSHDLWIRPDKYISSATMPIDLYDEYIVIRDDKQSDINAVHNDFISRMREGQFANINVEWEQYIEQIYAAGLEDMVEIFNKEEIKSFLFYTGGE